LIVFTQHSDKIAELFFGHSAQFSNFFRKNELVSFLSDAIVVVPEDLFEIALARLDNAVVLGLGDGLGGVLQEFSQLSAGPSTQRNHFA
jgi:hypothetical protein